MDNPALLTESDLRAVLRVVNEARDLPRGSRDQLEHVVRGLAGLTGAQVGASCSRWRCAPDKASPCVE